MTYKGVSKVRGLRWLVMPQRLKEQWGATPVSELWDRG